MRRACRQLPGRLADVRVGPVGVLDGAGERGRLDEVELGGRLAEEALGGGLDAVRAGAEVGDVQIVLKDLVLGVLLLDGHGVAQLVELAADARSRWPRPAPLWSRPS